MTTYYLADGLGSTRSLADGSGNVTDTYRYDAFGTEVSHAGPSTQPFRYTGEQEDGEVTGDLYYLRAPYHHPAVGRFLSRDPVPYLQRHAYVGNNPVNLVDPSGLSTLHPNTSDYLNPWLKPTPERLAVASAMAAAWECIQENVTSNLEEACKAEIAALNAAVEAARLKSVAYEALGHPAKPRTLGTGALTPGGPPRPGA